MRTIGRLLPRRREGLVTPAIVILISLALVLPPLLASSGNVAGTASFLIQFGFVVLIYAIVTLGLNVQVGYAGISNFGVAGFVLVGAYVAGIFVTPPASSEFITYVGGFGPALDLFPFLRSDQWLPHLIGVVAAAGAAGLLALLIVPLTPRLRLDYLAIATIGIAELLRTVVTVEGRIVNGDNGLIGIPHPLAGFFRPDAYPIVFLVLTAVVVLIVYLASERAVRSPWGRVLRALREDEIGTAAVGKNVIAFKAQAFVLGAAIMGIGGAMFAYYRGALTPSDFEPLQGTFLFWVMLVVGGTGNNRGAILGAFVVWGFWVASLQVAALPLPDEITSRVPFLRLGALGIFFIVMLLLRPEGLLPEERRVSKWAGRARGSGPPPEVQEP
jgi:branched-chain amino acid transport system permease protein